MDHVETAACAQIYACVSQCTHVSVRDGKLAIAQVHADRCANTCSRSFEPIRCRQVDNFKAEITFGKDTETCRWS